MGLSSVNDKNETFITSNIHMPVTTKFLHGIATNEWAFMGGPIPKTNPRWQTGAIWNFVTC